MEDVHDWILKNINSCNSLVQLKNCRNLIYLFSKKYEKEHEYDKLESILNVNLSIKTRKYL